MQTASRAALELGVALIRKMRPFEESHTFASHNDAVVEQSCRVSQPFGRDFFTEYPLLEMH
jgi:hypothetical protein